MRLKSFTLFEGSLNQSQRASSTAQHNILIAGSLSVAVGSEDVHIGGLTRNFKLPAGVSGCAGESAGCF